MKKTMLLFYALCLALMLQAKGEPTRPASSMQFTANGHILLFEEKGITVASASHAMTVKFVKARGVQPVADSTLTTPSLSVPEAPGMPGANPGIKDKTPALGTVTYTNIWKGVTLEYTNSPQGIYESTYHLTPDKKGRVDAGRIRLQYNRDLTLDKSGNLIIHYPNGTLTESAPIAWQDIDGRRVPVPVAYTLHGRNCVSFTLGAYRPGIPVTIDPTLSWNTFLGGSGSDNCYGITMDASGNVYVCGFSTASWGSPIRAYTGGTDGFVAKLTSAGELSWNTFLGSSGEDLCYSIALDSAYNIYACGQSSATWGSPKGAYTSGNDAFVAKLALDGSLTWNTFLGGSGADFCRGIAVGKTSPSMIYVCGQSSATWGSPVRAYTSGNDVFVAKLALDGSLKWNTFLGGTGANDDCRGIAVDASNVYVAGNSSASWGSPVRAFTLNEDAFVSKLAYDGGLVWNTFLGSDFNDKAFCIALDASSNIYISGYSFATWGSPARAYSGGMDMFVAKLASDGTLSWNTFLGGTGGDSGNGIAVDASSNVYVVGQSTATWGSPVTAYVGGADVSVAKLASDGTLSWNTFMGSTANDYSLGAALDASTNVYISGYSSATWGSPIRAYTSGNDGLVAKISYTPIVSTQAATAVSTTTATLNGSISSFDGTTSATDYGFCYSSTNTIPTTSDTKVSKGATSTTGAYSSSITGLTAGTKYYVRAYAINSYGTGYGDVVSFVYTKQLTLKAYLEGLWNGTTMNKCKKWDAATSDVVDLFSGTVVDTVSVELHNATTYATILYKAHGLELHADGSINTTGKSYIEIPITYTGSYRITVKQRDHLETTSASAVSFAGSTISYDFTDASTKAYLSDASFTPTKLLNSKWMLYAGDAVVTTSYPEINMDDIYEVFNQNSAKVGVYGYLATDVNGDGIVDDTDLYIVFANRDKFLYIP